MAVGWGGLAAAIGLLVGAERGDLTRTVAVVAAFGLGGFLAGIRAELVRPLHSFLAAVAAYAFFALFVVLAHVANVLGGPDPPGFIPGTTRTWFMTVLVAVTAALLGGTVAAGWLRPQREDRRRHRD